MKNTDIEDIIERGEDELLIDNITLPEKKEWGHWGTIRYLSPSKTKTRGDLFATYVAALNFQQHFKKCIENLSDLIAKDMS